MVESSGGDRGAEEERPPYGADVIDTPEKMNGLHSQAISPRDKKRECSPVNDDGGQNHSFGLLSCAKSPCGASLAESYDELRHQQNCPSLTVQIDAMTLQNGNEGDICQDSLDVKLDSKLHTVESRTTEKGGKFTNGKLFKGLTEASVDTDTTSASLTTDVNSGSPKHQVHPTPTETQLASVSHDGDEPSSAGSHQSSQASILSPSDRQAEDHSLGEQVETKGHPSDNERASRPHSLRTISNNSTHFLSCDSTPLSPDDEVSFPRTGLQQDLTFMDVSLNSRNTYEISRRQSAPDNIPGVLSVVASDQALRQKKHGISELFGRSLFSRKQKDTSMLSQSAPGWKLFGKVPLRENTPKDSRTIQQDSNQGNLTSVSTPNLLSTGEYEAKTGKVTQLPSQSTQGRRKNLDFEPLSTTALILEDRPANLPAKSEEEAQRHRQEYDEMVAEAKKRELKEAQKKKRQMKERFKQEESIANAMVIWNNEILPNWESMRGTRKVRELWWQGLPPNVRGKVWSLAIGNELNITPELYEIFLSRAKERWRSFRDTGCETEAEADSGASLADRESSLDLIKLDISRTFPSLFIFQKGGPYHDVLHSVLGAYTCYRPDVGYVQGMSFIAAVLILNLEEADAFIAFANLLNKPCQMAFFRVDHDLMLKYFAAFEVFFEENLPRLFKHFQSYNLTPDLYLIDWIFTLYSKSLPLDVACRVWDVFCRDGEEYLFRTGLGILRLYEEVLLQMDFIHIAQFLSRLPDDLVPDRLFSSIAAIQMISGNRKWSQVFSSLIKEKEMDKNNSPSLKSS
ncbi:TBC1 domain family member 12 [Chanos chanos]|uniref:TBC1 domain family member 12 n=1 Tax=Chanos chanos TaxID=29144 RepID=A0A6J2VGI3_CHACN|nr:TBC1 domain family member 12 [Chanos chanos]